jgi:hypothetical protein
MQHEYDHHVSPPYTTSHRSNTHPFTHAISLTFTLTDKRSRTALDTATRRNHMGLLHWLDQQTQIRLIQQVLDTFCLLPVFLSYVY